MHKAEVIIVLLVLIVGLYKFYSLIKFWLCKDSYCVPIKTHNEQNIQAILIVGRTGSGKSTLANVLLGKEKFAEVSGSSSGTKGIQNENFEWNGNHYCVIDTIGTGDTSGLSDKEIESIIEETLRNLGGNDIKRIFFVYKDRFTKEQVQAFQTLDRLIRFIKIGLYVTIVCSNFVGFMDKGKCESDIKKLLKENKNIARVIKGCKVIHVDNPPLEYEGARERRKFSREKLLNHLDETATENSNTDIDVNEIIEELTNS